MNAPKIGLKSALSTCPHLMCFKSLQELWHGADQPAECTEEDCPHKFWCYIATPQHLTWEMKEGTDFLANDTNQM